ALACPAPSPRRDTRPVRSGRCRGRGPTGPSSSLYSFYGVGITKVARAGLSRKRPDATSVCGCGQGRAGRGPGLCAGAPGGTRKPMTTMTDEQKRIRGYLEAQGAKLSPPAIVEKVREAMGRLRAAALAVP